MAVAHKEAEDARLQLTSTESRHRQELSAERHRVAVAGAVAPASPRTLPLPLSAVCSTARQPRPPLAAPTAEEHLQHIQSAAAAAEEAAAASLQVAEAAAAGALCHMRKAARYSDRRVPGRAPQTTHQQ